MRVLVIVAAALLIGGCGRQEAEDTARPKPTVQFERAAANPVEHGQRLGSVLGCSGCHGEDPRGKTGASQALGSSGLPISRDQCPATRMSNSPA
jgi:mono/diheme cytochrome c family protein